MGREFSSASAAHKLKMADLTKLAGHCSCGSVLKFSQLNMAVQATHRIHSLAHQIRHESRSLGR